MYEDDSMLMLRPDGCQFAAFDRDSSLRLFDTPSGEEIQRYPAGCKSPVQRGTRGSRKSPCRTTQDCFILDLESGEKSPVPFSGVSPSMDWSPDGQILAVVADRRIHLWDTAKRCLAMPPLIGHKSDNVKVRFNHAGDRLMSLDWSNLWRLWDTHTGVQLLTMPAGGEVLSLSRDDCLVGADISPPRIRLYRIHPGHEFRTMIHLSNAQPSAYDPRSVLCDDGRLLAIHVPEGTALIDVVRHQEIEVLANPDNPPFWFDENARELWTKGNKGLLGWPLHTGANSSESRLGPPRPLGSVTLRESVGVSSDGNTVAIPNFARGALLWQARG